MNTSLYLRSMLVDLDFRFINIVSFYKYSIVL
jgi:hypothetical protein